ncbi:EAL domain-containing protein [Pseudomaricurvus alkylphenolicus]|uniref:EAL domain-containing protein n=1 Tax=Pseudomaricurvus alkylphenolicus TaxID=1306991 RepID=UPI001422CE08|nr:EAL domain-containing protein [Pseudomaricurvus alkylphenolicus]NIB39998.1 EAL domain-containing protein [Pseudomaricurvus alkylphenolicus]
MNQQDPIIAMDRFEAHFQPLIHLASGRVAGYESLARQRLESGKLISAGAMFFNPGIPAARKLALDRQLRRQSLRCFSNNVDAGFISLNISPDWVDMLSEEAISPTVSMVRESGIDPSRVLVEITECNGQIANLQRLARQYQQAGFRLAIDDFGAGASQMDRLIALQPDYIKLDMDLFRRASKGGAEANVVLSITALAQRAGSRIICEGVETEQELHFAIECGADLIQGWLFDGALPAPVAGDYYCEQLTELKSSYLQRKSQHLSGSFEHNRKVAAQVRQLGEIFTHAGCLETLTTAIDLQLMQRLGILRCYLCDSSGTQLSGNLEFSPGEVARESHYLGSNWSHRPYFAQLIAMRQIQPDHIVVSTPYRDISSGSFCKTYGIFAGDDQVLLFDVWVKDDVLFQLR